MGEPMAIALVTVACVGVLFTLAANLSASRRRKHSPVR